MNSVSGWFGVSVRPLPKSRILFGKSLGGDYR